jgi:hypothetical protein
MPSGFTLTRTEGDLYVQGAVGHATSEEPPYEHMPDYRTTPLTKIIILSIYIINIYIMRLALRDSNHTIAYLIEPVDDPHANREQYALYAYVLSWLLFFMLYVPPLAWILVCAYTICEETNWNMSQLEEFLLASNEETENNANNESKYHE